MMSQMQEAERAPISERPTQINAIAEQAGEQAEGRTCRTCGQPECPYPTDTEVKARVSEDPEWLRHPECWQPFPVEVKALEAIRNGLYVAGIDHDDLDYIAGKVMTKLDDAGLLRKSALDVARGVEPDAWNDSMVWLHPHRSRSPRPRAVAEKIAAALVAEFGGVVVDDDGGTPSEDYRRIRVNVERADYYVPYDPEEG